MIDDLINEACNGDSSAEALVRSLFIVSQNFDDYYDQDKPIIKSEVETALWLVLVEIPENRFYQENYNQIHPIIKRSIIDWMDANAIESEGKTAVSFVLRSTISSILIEIALITGGYTRMRMISQKVRNMLYFGAEAYNYYKEPN